jgi:chaperonin GroEL
LERRTGVQDRMNALGQDARNIGSFRAEQDSRNINYNPDAVKKPPKIPDQFGKRVEYGDEARKALISGVDKCANAVRVTMGPRGRNVVVARSRAEEDVVIINDGVSIAEDVILDDQAEQVGVKLLLQACSKTDSRAGDGTTTAAVLTQAMVHAGELFVSNGSNSMAIQSGLLKVAAFFVEKIRAAAKPVTTLEEYASIAGISAGSEKMGAIVAEAIMRVGGDGSTTTEQGRSYEDTIEYSEGLEHEVGYIDEAFVTEVELQNATLEEPRVLVTDQKIALMSDVLPVLEGVVGEKVPLLIFCADLVGEAKSGLIMNKKGGVLDVCVVKAPGFGSLRQQYLEDFCIFSGATFITTQLGKKLEEVTMADLGYLKRAVVTEKKTTMVSSGKFGEEVKQRIDVLKQQIESKLGNNKEFDIPRLDQRIQ